MTQRRVCPNKHVLRSKRFKFFEIVLMFVAPCIPIIVFAFLFVFFVFFIIVSHGIHIYTIALYSNFQIRTLKICVKDAGGFFIWSLGGTFSFSGFPRALAALFCAFYFFFSGIFLGIFYFFFSGIS